MIYARNSSPKKWDSKGPFTSLKRPSTKELLQRKRIISTLMQLVDKVESQFSYLPWVSSSLHIHRKTIFSQYKWVNCNGIFCWIMNCVLGTRSCSDTTTTLTNPSGSSPTSLGERSRIWLLPIGWHVTTKVRWQEIWVLSFLLWYTQIRRNKK